MLAFPMDSVKKLNKLEQSLGALLAGELCHDGFGPQCQELSKELCKLNRGEGDTLRAQLRVLRCTSACRTGLPKAR